MLLQCELSKPQRMPLLVPFAEMDGSGPANENAFALIDVGEVETRPELFALKEYAFSGSASPV